MLFATLAPRRGGWSEAATEALAAQWQQLLLTGALTPSLYPLQGGRMLLALHRGWRVDDALEFLASRPEVQRVQWAGQELDAAGITAFLARRRGLAPSKPRQRQRKRRRKRAH